MDHDLKEPQLSSDWAAPSSHSNVPQNGPRPQVTPILDGTGLAPCPTNSQQNRPCPQVKSIFNWMGRALKSHQVPSERASPACPSNFQESRPRLQLTPLSPKWALPASHTPFHQNGPRPLVTPVSRVTAESPTIAIINLYAVSWFSEEVLHPQLTIGLLPTMHLIMANLIPSQVYAHRSCIWATFGGLLSVVGGLNVEGWTSRANG